MPGSALDVKRALKALCESLFPDAHVTWGPPGSYIPHTTVSVGDQTFDVERPTMGASRSREDVVATEVLFTAFVAGDVEAQEDATGTVYGMALELDQHLRTKPNETLSGACREAYVVSGALVEAKAKPRAGGGVAGRLSALTVTVNSRARRA